MQQSDSCFHFDTELGIIKPMEPTKQNSVST